MGISLDHVVIQARDREASARFYLELAEARSVEAAGPYGAVVLDDGLVLQFAESPAEFPPQHYAFRVDDAHFERVMRRIREGGLEHWADPELTQPGLTREDPGGRGVYLMDPAGHFVEFITRGEA
ncbi:VOC family protein [Paeniglutamicibacter sp. R2-26]|uniref:VOC family protein n=1 Tax=Paeniglutamicibacter sp. R2-26 TaxID=3144417 RepID=UPI003EE70117